MREKIKSILKESLMLQEIDDNIDRMQTAEWDSLKHLMLISNLEEEFDINIDPDQFTELNNLESIEKIVLSLKNE